MHCLRIVDTGNVINETPSGPVHGQEVRFRHASRHMRYASCCDEKYKLHNRFCAGRDTGVSRYCLSVRVLRELGSATKICDEQEKGASP